MDEFVGGPIENDLAFIQNQKLCAVVDTIVRNGFDLSGLLVEAVSGQEESVLQTVGDDQRRCVSDVALLDNQLDDGG